MLFLFVIRPPGTVFSGFFGVPSGIRKFASGLSDYYNSDVFFTDGCMKLIGFFLRYQAGLD